MRRDLLRCRRRGFLGAQGISFTAVGLVELEQDLLLSLREMGVGQDRGGDITVAVPLFKDPRLDVQRLGGNPQCLGDLLEDLGTGLAEAALDLAEIGVRDASQGCQLPQRDLRGRTLLADVVPEVAHVDLGHEPHPTALR